MSCLVQVEGSIRLARRLDAAEQRSAALESEVTALRKALQDCQSRHAEQLARWVRGDALGSHFRAIAAQYMGSAGLPVPACRAAGEVCKWWCRRRPVQEGITAKRMSFALVGETMMQGHVGLSVPTAEQLAR